MRLVRPRRVVTQRLPFEPQLVLVDTVKAPSTLKRMAEHRLIVQ